MANKTFAETYQGVQFGRYINVVAFSKNWNAINLSELRIKFSVKRSQDNTPNMLDIRIYNIETNTALALSAGYNRIVVQAGYQNNYGGIFAGNIVQVILGREDQTDTYVDIIAQEADLPYNFGVINGPPIDGPNVDATAQFNYIVSQLDAYGVSAGYTNIGSIPNPVSLPRGKTFFGPVKDIIYRLATANGCYFNFEGIANPSTSTSDTLLQLILKGSYLPTPIIILTPKTGMIGVAQQTSWGVMVKALINPSFKTGQRIQINNATTIPLKYAPIPPSTNNSVKTATQPLNVSPPPPSNGVYIIWTIEFEGDTRGDPWYANMMCITSNTSEANQLLSIPENIT